jgi:hypothetical protein
MQCTMSTHAFPARAQPPHRIFITTYATCSSCGPLSSFFGMASSMARCPMDPSSPQASVFLASCETLQATLSDHQRRTFANCDAKQALEAAKRLNDENQEDSRFRGGMSVVNDWIVGVQRYFAVVDTLVSAKPEVAALIWGCIRFLIEVRSQTFGGRSSF